MKLGHVDDKRQALGNFMRIADQGAQLMPHVTKRMQLKAYLVYSVAAIFGLGLAWFVFSGMQAVQQTATVLTQKQIPALMLARELAANLNEQERILYEYYATTQSRLYTNDYVELQQRLKSQLADLMQLSGNIAMAEMAQELQQITVISAQLHQNLSQTAIDWDLAREQLSALSLVRRQLLPQLDQLSELVEKDMSQGHQQTLSQLSATSSSVAVFSVGLLLVSLLMGRYAANYIRLSVANARLAMFPQRNPNPVLSLSADCHVVYHNPATTRLLLELGLSEDPHLLFPATLYDEFVQIKKQHPPIKVFQQQVQQRHLRYEVHWLSDIDAYDIHVQDLTQQIQAELELTHHAYHHELSGLPNRQQFFADVAELMKADLIFSVALIEFSHYARLLSHYGLDGMADIVKLTSQTLQQDIADWQQQQSLRPVLYQISDASFAVLITAANAHPAAQSLAQVLIKSTERSSAVNGQLLVPLQIGVTEYPRCSKQPEDLLLHAQIALNQTVSGVTFFDHQTGARHQRQLMLNDRLSKAIENHELELYFQPQMFVEGRMFSGAETLIRWKLDGQFISPAEFIPLAEQSGFILPLGDWILETAIEKAASMQQQGELRIAVNISARQFMQADFVERVVSLTRKYRLPAHCLELEITESMVMENEQAGLAVLKALKGHGYCLAIDDFGTGYSSLAYLKNFPVDKLKIDQSFIRSMPQDHKDQAIVLSLCQLAKNFGMSVIAEGVETPEQLMLLGQYQCDAIQGYWYSKPLPEHEFRQFFSRRTLTAE